MTQLIQRDEWVAMQLTPNAESTYRTGALEELTGLPALHEQRVALRVMFKSPTLTKSLMRNIWSFTERLLSRGVHANARRVVEGMWTRESDANLYFVVDTDQRLRSVAADRVQAVARAWAEMRPSDTAHPYAVVEFLRHDRHVPLAQAWEDLRQSLELDLGAVATQATVTEPTVVIQTNPAEARRATLLALGWPTSTAVGKANGSTSSNPGQWAKDKRDAEQLLGVWDVGKRTFRHPAFQFDEVGQLRPEVKTLLAALAEHPDRTATADANGWRRAYWLYQPFRSLSRRALAFAAAHPLGHGNALQASPEGALATVDEWLAYGAPEDALARTPAEVFAENPEAVIAHAHHAAVVARPDTDAEGRPHAE